MTGEAAAPANQTLKVNLNERAEEVSCSSSGSYRGQMGPHSKQAHLQSRSSMIR